MEAPGHNAVEESIRAFPAISGAAVKMLDLLNDPDADAAEVEKVMRYDPGLTANILKLANSAWFAAPGTIGSIRQAVVRLGWKKVYQLAIVSSVHAVMEEPVDGYDLTAGELWRHAVGVSVAAEYLAQEIDLRAPEETFTAALLHDVGKLVMSSQVDADFNKIDGLCAAGAPFEEAERKVLGLDHAEAGARILEKWSLPSSLVGAVRWHHEPDRADPPCTLVDLVHVADVLCLVIGIGIGRDGLQYKPSEGAVARLGIKTAHLERVASRTLQGVEELMSALE